MRKWLDMIRWVRKTEIQADARLADDTPLPPVFAKMLQVHILETTIKR
jgi:hypothetical protein